MKIVVLGGGDSDERDVSLRSAASVATAARQAHFLVEEADPAKGLSFLDGLDPAETIVLPILHGKGGEDGGIQQELEKRKLPFLGSDSRMSSRCFDKWGTRLALISENIPMATGLLVTRETYAGNLLSKKPHVLKIVHGGSSIGTLVIRDPKKIDQKRVYEIFNLENEVVMEELIEGIESTVPILDQTALTPIEIQPPPTGEFDYANKYNGQTQELCPPKTIALDTQDELKTLAEKVHKIMGARHLSRVDIMLDKNNHPYVLEINTMPGLTNRSLFPKAAAVAGLTMPDLVSFFVDMVKRDYKISN